MPHLLAKLKNYSLAVVNDFLEKDKVFHASQGMYIEHVWQNADNDNEVFFLFKIDHLENTKKLIHKLHSEALEQDPNVNLPSMTYLTN